MPKTVIISDCHFGYEGFNRPQFELYLDHLEKERDGIRLVLLGDIFDLWRADPIDSVSFAYGYLDRLRRLSLETHYVVGNHDYHNWASCLALNRPKDYLWMNVHYPYYILDEDILLIHGDYFDIHRFSVAEKAIYAVYEAIYYAYEPTVKTLEDYFWNPLELLKKWVQLYERSPASAKSDPLAGYLSTIVNTEKTSEVRKLSNGLKYLADNYDKVAQIFVPAYVRPSLRGELPSPQRKRITKKSRAEILGIDTSAPVRVMLLEKSILDLARQISGNVGIAKVIYGHTHKAEGKPSQGCWNTGSWVCGESTLCQVENGQVNAYRFKAGEETPITEKC